MKTLSLRIWVLKDKKDKGVNSGAFKAILNPLNTSNKTNVLNWLYYGQCAEEGWEGWWKRKGRKGRRGSLLPAVTLQTCPWPCQPPADSPFPRLLGSLWILEPLSALTSEKFRVAPVWTSCSARVSALPHAFPPATLCQGWWYPSIPKFKPGPSTFIVGSSPGLFSFQTL